MKLTPISNRVIVRQDPASKTTEGGIVIPDSVQKKPSCGIVVAVYKSYLTSKGAVVYPQVKVGDRVIFIPYAPEKIIHDGEELLLIKESDIFTIWHKDDKPNLPVKD